MKKLLPACIILIATTAAAQTSTSALLEATLVRVRTQLEAQIERIKRAREVADARINLAGIRAEQQLLKAEEDLTVQNERLKILQEQVIDQLKDADQSYLAFKNELRPALTQAVRNIRSQITVTNNLITQLQRAQTNSAAQTAGSVSGSTRSCPYEDQGMPYVLPDSAPPSLAELETELSFLEAQSSFDTGYQSMSAVSSSRSSCTSCGK